MLGLVMPLEAPEKPCVPQRHGLDGEESACLFLKGLFATNSTGGLREKPGAERWLR